MPTILTWHDIARRLLVTAACAGVPSFDRDQRGHSAGLRTTLLLALAASLAMIRANWLLGVTTVATIWFVTVMGPCFGGGQIGLGFAGFVLGFAVLTGLKEVRDSHVDTIVQSSKSQ